MMKDGHFEIPKFSMDEFFERFAGAAAFVLWDGKHVQLLRANAEYHIELETDGTLPEKLDLLSFVDVPYREQYRRAAETAAETDCEQVCENRRHTFNQCCGTSEIWVRTRLRRVSNVSDGCILFASVRNITREKIQFEAVSESDRRFRYAAEQANVYAWEYRIDTKQMRPCYRCMRDLGLPALLENYPEPAIEMGIFPQDYADLYRDWHRQLENGASSLEGIIPLTASRVPFHVRYTTVFDSEGKPVKAFGSATQVIETEKEREYHNIIGKLASTYAAIYYVDMVNLTFVELGRSGDYVEHVIGEKGDAVRAMERMCDHIISRDQVDDMREFTDFKTLNDRLKDHFWICRQFQAGSGRWNEGLFIAARRDEDGNCLNVIWAVRDINEVKLREIAYQQELEKARDTANAASEAKTKFLFNMSHDIRTPMNAIMGYTDLIEKHYDDREKCMDYLHKTQQSNRFLLSLINDVLEMARIESGKAELNEVVSPTGGIAREMSAIFEDQMRQKGITFISHIETHTKWAFYDQAKVREIYLNILSNALKYTPAGGTVSMQVNEIPWKTRGYIGIKAVFSDTGIGMSEEFLPHLFESFTRERTATESRQQGTGLGMPIVKKIIELMGGTIDVESSQGKGTTFTVIYPLRAEGAAAVPDRQQEEQRTENYDFAGRRILLAEDNELNAEIATEILSEAGFLVECAGDGLVCLDKLKGSEKGYYDLILMDIQMPNMDGYEAARQIRALPEKEKAKIPIVAMTANAFETDRQDALHAGMNGHVAKPIEIPKLMKTLAQILD